jgi:putative ABC transport system permease protein
MHGSYEQMNQYRFQVTFYDIALLGTVFIGLTLVLLLWFEPKRSRSANRFLALAFGAAALWILQVLAVDIELTRYYSFWRWVPLQFTLIIGPFIFFYVLKVTRPEYQFKRKDLLHFIPSLLQQGAHIFEAVESVKTVAGHGNVIFHWLHTVLQGLTFISVIIYLYQCRIIIDTFNKQRKFNGGDRHRYGLRWLHHQVFVFTLLWLFWIPFTAIDYFYHHSELTVQAYHPMYLVLMSALIYMAAGTFLRPDIDVALSTTLIFKPLLPLELKLKGIWLKRMVKENRYYEDPELSLHSLAVKLGLNAHELSRLLNTVLKKSFNDYINEQRVKAVIQKMRNPAYDKLTLVGIAYESGFNAQSTFNRIFKQITGKSPIEYKISLKKEQPSYNLGSRYHVAPVILDRQSNFWPFKKINGNIMFKNYFKIAWRNLSRNKSYAAINVSGLAVGIAVCMIIFILIQFQTSFDTYHTKKDRIFRVLTERHTDDGNVSYAKNVPFKMPEGLKTAFPELKQVAPVYASHDDELQVVDGNGAPVKNFKEQSGVFYTTPSFFEIFDFPMLEGSYASLKDPNNVLITKEVAQTYFGDWKTAMGKTIRITGYYSIGAGLFQFPPRPLKVTGILATIPANTDFQLRLVVAYGTDFTGDKEYGFQQPGNGTASNFSCYLLLPQNVSAERFNKQLKAYTRRTAPIGNKDSHIIQSIIDVHYDAEAGNYSNKTISHKMINVLWVIAAFILLIACVNFINLSTAQAVNRAKEVGVRKVLGSSRAQLQIQFIVETFLIVTGAVVLATTLTMLTLPHVNRLLELSLTYNIFRQPAIILFIVSLIIVVTALAGFYPSIILSRFNPVTALKSKITANTTNGFSLRRSLVVFQFVIAQILIVSTLVIVQQMHFFMNQPLGFDKDAIVNIPFRPDKTQYYLKQQLLQINGVKVVSFNSNTPAEDDNNIFTRLKFDNSIKDADFQAITKFADEGYLPAYKLKLVAGRNLDPSGWTKEFLVNESFVKSLGLKKPEDVLNKEVSIMDGVIKCPVVGVIKDFNNRSLRSSVAPLLIATNNTMYRQTSIKLSTTNLAATMASIKKIWQRSFPDYVYEYKFLDEKIESFYKQESQLSTLYKTFAGIAIFLSCLGLYGLASFMAVQRIKEVGIRKVLGATSASIVHLFSKEFVMLIGIAFAIAAPIAWYCMYQWLQGYAYRVNISWWLFPLSGLSATIIALITISFQALKAALANPVNSLRSE